MPPVLVTRGLTGDVVGIDPSAFVEWDDVMKMLSTITGRDRWRHQLWVGEERITDLVRLRQIDACILIVDGRPVQITPAYVFWDTQKRILAVSPADFVKYNRGPFTRARANAFFRHVCEQEVNLDDSLLECYGMYPDDTIVQSSWRDVDNDGEGVAT
jgi:hypothetical protein